MIERARNLAACIARCIKIIIAGLTVSALSALVSHADEPVGPRMSTQPPCDSPIHHQFDFWLGDWQVFDAATSQLVAMDHIEKQFEGCAVVQKMTWVSDQFRNPHYKYRLAGMSLNVVRGDQWVAMWVDNTYGGGLLVEGGLQADGSIALTTPTPRGGRYTRGVWIPNPDGTVRNVGYLSKDGKGGWTRYFEYLYKPNH